MSTPSTIHGHGHGLSECLRAIAPLDRSHAQAAQAHLDKLTKPRGSLGRLEHLARELTLISAARQDPPGSRPQADPARICVCAADHGVAAQGVSAFPQEVTAQMVANFLAGGAAVNVLARVGGVELLVVDAGVKHLDCPDASCLVRNPIRPGSADISLGPAMNANECIQALELGIRLADQAADQGVRTLGTGEMGIANTTAATALYSAWLGLDPADITGPGAGLDKDGMRRKTEVIVRALKINSKALPPAPPLDTLAALGGLEIACLSGLILGAAKRKLAMVIDGFIATAAYVAAWKMHPAVRDYAFFAHGSAEPGHKIILNHLGVRPILDLDMRLGEGTGAALAIPILRAAAAMYTDMASFSQAGVTSTCSSSLRPGH